MKLFPDQAINVSLRLNSNGCLTTVKSHGKKMSSPTSNHPISELTTPRLKLNLNSFSSGLKNGDVQELLVLEPTYLGMSNLLLNLFPIVQFTWLTIPYHIFSKVVLWMAHKLAPLELMPKT